jgi:hypothetical protein
LANLVPKAEEADSPSAPLVASLPARWWTLSAGLGGGLSVGLPGSKNEIISNGPAERRNFFNGTHTSKTLYLKMYVLVIENK